MMNISKRTLVRGTQVASILQPSSDRLQICSNVVSELAEGPLWKQSSQSLYWLDIINKKLFERSFVTNEISSWELPYTTTSMASDSFDPNVLWLISEEALVYFDITSGECLDVLSIVLPKGYRTNDGSVGPDGKYWFGTMLNQPQPNKGSIFSIDKDRNLKLELEGIAIPNTFSWLNDGRLILSDSLIRKSCFYKSNSNLERGDTFLDLSDTLGTPDGGAVDEKGNIWIALWGLGKVVCYSPEGKEIQEISLPVPQPSSCCFGGIENDILFITTAREGLTPTEIQKYPYSGKVFCIKLSVKGVPMNNFSLELVC